jgi:hypothetical protein
MIERLPFIILFFPFLSGPKEKTEKGSSDKKGQRGIDIRSSGKIGKLSGRGEN